MNTAVLNRTPTRHEGTIQLVTPIRILTNAAGNLPGFGTQTSTFIPEPGDLLLCTGALSHCVGPASHEEVASAGSLRVWRPRGQGRHLPESSNRFPAGDTEAWIATIPEPTTALLLASGLAAVAKRRRRLR